MNIEAKLQQAVIVDGETLSLSDFWKVVVDNKSISLHPSVYEKVTRSRQIIEQAISEKSPVYGVTTGFGKFKDQTIAAEDTRLLQRNLILSHACGVGEMLSNEVVRGMLLLRLNNLARGYSGVRYEVILLLMEFINNGVYPVVPSRGSVGASGDLAPLAHLALPMIGEGEVCFNGSVYPTNKILQKLELKPLTLEAKEGLALINGTQAMTSMAALAFIRGRCLLTGADIAGAMSLEALMGSKNAFKEELQRLRPYDGQLATAKNMERILDGSILMDSHKECAKVQDAYSLRCMPQVHGAVKEALRDIGRIITTELNAVTDNPLVFPKNSDEEGASAQILSGGNFHGHPISLYFDFFRTAITSLANISERRTDRLLNPATSELPAFLVKEGGINSGLMIPQYVQASLVAECKLLSSPCSVDSIPTSAYQEDFVTMGTTSAKFALQIVEHAERVIGIEMLVAAQALEFRRPLTFGIGTEAALKTIRTHISFMERDRYLKPDIDLIVKLLQDVVIQQAVEEAAGPLSYI